MTPRPEPIPEVRRLLQRAAAAEEQAVESAAAAPEVVRLCCVLKVAELLVVDQAYGVLHEALRSIRRGHTKDDPAAIARRALEDVEVLFKGSAYRDEAIVQNLRPRRSILRQ